MTEAQTRDRHPLSLVDLFAYKIFWLMNWLCWLALHVGLTALFLGQARIRPQQTTGPPHEIVVGPPISLREQGDRLDSKSKSREPSCLTSQARLGCSDQGTCHGSRIEMVSGSAALDQCMRFDRPVEITWNPC